MNAARKIIKEPIDWVKFFNALAGAVMLVMAFWVKIDQNKNTAVIEKVSRQTDGIEAASKLKVAIAERKTADATNLPEDIKRANDSEAAVDAKNKVQENTDKPKLKNQ